MTESPLIINGDLVLTDTGLLDGALDIETQMTVTVSAYDCIYDSNLNSPLIPLLQQIPNAASSINLISNAVVSAYTPIMITNQLISSLQVAVQPLAVGYVSIKISAVDTENNQLNLKWTNS